jgi:predicted RNase H-like HicB family nuclease
MRSDKMETKKSVYFKDGNMWIGWLEEYPDYRTQGETLEELEENLRDIYADLSAEAIPYVHRVGELRVA